MKNKTQAYRTSLANTATRRAGFYDFFVGALNHLPEPAYLEKIKANDFEVFLNACCNLSTAGFKKGVARIKSYKSAMAGKSNQTLLEDLSVDRTRILRGTGHPHLKPPYEGLYKDRKNSGQPLLEIKRFYRGAGLLPEDSVHESPDYICVQLDFMKHMCLRERDQWASDNGALETIAQEKAFLNNHLGSWIGAFCDQVNQHALTDFYRGIAMILDAFVATEMSYLEDLGASLG